MSVLYAWNVHEVLLFISTNIYKNAICCGSKVYDIHCTIDLCIRLTIMEKENKLYLKSKPLSSTLLMYDDARSVW